MLLVPRDGAPPDAEDVKEVVVEGLGPALLLRGVGPPAGEAGGAGAIPFQESLIDAGSRSLSFQQAQHREYAAQNRERLSSIAPAKRHVRRASKLARSPSVERDSSSVRVVSSPCSAAWRTMSMMAPAYWVARPEPVSCRAIAWVSITKSCYHGCSGCRSLSPKRSCMTQAGDGAPRSRSVRGRQHRTGEIRFRTRDAARGTSLL